MRQLIEYFLERQKIVAIAMLDIHPKPLLMAGKYILGIKIAPYVLAWREKANQDRNWQSGIWRGEWKHWAHGYGCRLTNLRTGEPIEWDAPDLDTFDEHWFWAHLAWRIEQTAPPDKVEPYSQWLWSIYNYMRDQELIVPARNNQWKLK